MRRFALRRWPERNGKVVAQSVYYDENRLVEGLWVPTTILRITSRGYRTRRPRRTGILKRKNVTLRFTLQDQPSQQEPLCEKVHTNDMQEAVKSKGQLAQIAQRTNEE